MCHRGQSCGGVCSSKGGGRVLADPETTAACAVWVPTRGPSTSAAPRSLGPISIPSLLFLREAGSLPSGFLYPPRISVRVLYTPSVK